MTRKHFPISNWRLTAFAAQLVIVVGCLDSTYAQPLPTIPSALSMRASDPSPDRNYPTIARGNSSSRLPSSRTAVSAAKQKIIKEAIKVGNKARGENQYELAVASYERVKGLDPEDERAHYGLGNVYTDLSCPDSAIASYRAALTLKKDYRDAISALGFAFANKQRFDEAESQFQELLKSKKGDPAGNIGMAFVSWKRKKYDDATKQLKVVTDNQTMPRADRASAFLVTGDIYREREKWGEARAAYQQAIALNPGDELSRWISIAGYVGLAQTELFPAMAVLSHLTAEEVVTEDRERVIKAARQAEEHVRRAVYELKFEHPNGYLFWGLALEYQFRFADAETKFNTYLKKIEELEKQVPSLAKTKTCDYGFDTLRANYHKFIGYLHQQERSLTTDPQRISELNNKSVESFKQVIRLKGDDAAAYKTLAGVYFLQGKHAEAAEHYEKALSRETDESKKADYYFGRGTSYVKTGRVKEGIDDINRAIALRPEYPTQYWFLALVYEKEGKWSEALSAAQQAFEREKPPRAHSYYFLASTYLRAARRTGKDAYYEEAIQLANKATEISATYSSAYLLLGQIYKTYKEGTKVEEAIKNYELAAKYDPKNPQIPYGLGDLYLLLKNENAAIKSFRDAITLKPDFAEAYRALGLAYIRKGGDAEAVKQFESAIKHDAKYLNAYLDLADVYDTQKNYQEAIRWLLKATEEFPTDYLPYKELARLYTHSKNNAEAIQYYEKAIRLIKGDDAWFGEVMKCRVLRLQRKYPESISCAQSLNLPASGDPNQIPYEIGLTHVASGNKEAALRQYEELKKKASNLAENLLRQINEMK